MHDQPHGEVGDVDGLRLRAATLVRGLLIKRREVGVLEYWNDGYGSCCWE